MKKWTLLLVASALFSVLIGCQAAEPEGKETETPTTTTSSTAEPSPEGSAKLVEYRNKDGKLVCPIMGEVIEDESKVEDWVQHEGKNYALCCASCVGPAKKDPAMVAQKAAELDAKG